MEKRFRDSEARNPRNRCHRRSSSLDQLDLPRWRGVLFAQHLRALLDELGHDAYGNFGYALSFNPHSDGTSDFFQLFFGRNLFQKKMLEDGPGFARAADHP